MLAKTSLVRASGIQPFIAIAGAARKFHSEEVFTPQVPLALHDPQYFFLIPEDSSPLKMFQPEIPKVDIALLKKFSAEAISNIMKFRARLLQRTGEIDLVLISNQALQTAKDMPSRFNNYLVSYDGVISVEKIVPIEKFKTNVRDVGAKLNDLTDKIPISGMQEKWEVVKGKMPAWQATIATKLQDFQDTINKRFNPKKTD